MKAMKLPKEIESLLDVAEAAEEETLVFTKKRRPVAALVSVPAESVADESTEGSVRSKETEGLVAWL